MRKPLAIPRLGVTWLAAAGLAALLLAPPAIAGEASPSDVPAAPEAAPETAAPAPCCPAACVRYRHHRLCRVHCCCDCRGPVETVLEVKDPRCCCAAPVPVTVCVPPCCEGPPSVCSRIGLFRRGIVEYQWCCGYRVKVVFGRCGNVTVHTYGR